MRGEKGFDNLRIFLGQQAAGRIDEAAARLEQLRGGGEDGRLL